MGWLAKIFHVTEPAPAAVLGPTVEESRAARIAELLAQVHRFDADLAQLAKEKRAFRADNFTFLGGQMFLRREKLKTRGQVERENERLRRLELQILSRRSGALIEWAQLKAAQEHTQ
jgi:hypothetical protein